MTALDIVRDMLAERELQFSEFVDSLSDGEPGCVDEYELYDNLEGQCIALREAIRRIEQSAVERASD